MEIAHSGMTVFTSRPHLKTMPRFNMLPFFLCPGGSKSGVACLIPAHLKASALFCVCLFQATDKCLPPWCFPCPSPLTSRLTGCFSLAETLVGFAHKAADVRCFKHRSTWGWKECHKEMIVKIPVFQARLFLFPFFFFFPAVDPVKQASPFSLTQSASVLLSFLTLLQVSWLKVAVPKEKCSSENVMTSWPQMLPLFIVRLNYSCPPWITSLCKGMS